VHDVVADRLPAERPARNLRPLLAGVLAAAAVGGVLGVTALVSDDPAPAPAPPSDLVPTGPGPQVGKSIRTSFGTLSVDYVVRLIGTSNPMGLKVEPGQVPLQIGVTITNLDERRSVKIDAAAFRLPGASNGIVDVGRLSGNRVASLRSHRFTLRYSAPAGPTLPTLNISDPGRRTPVAVPLGSMKDLVDLDVVTHRYRYGTR
jgi:hypothetical protein